MKPWSTACACLGLLLVGATAGASPPEPPPWVAPELLNVTPEHSEGLGSLAFENLTPVEQQLLQRFAERWSSLPPQRREALVQGARRWLAATPEERRRWREYFHRWRSLPPEEQERLRERWESLGPEERERLRDSLRFGPPPRPRPPPGARPLPGPRPPPHARPPGPPPSLDREV
jgi:hypothetical protein